MIVYWWSRLIINYPNYFLCPKSSHYIGRILIYCAGGEAAEGAIDDDARAPRNVDGARAEPLHPDGGGVRRPVHRRAVGDGGPDGRHRERHRHSARGDDHLPVLRDLREGTGGGWRLLGALLLRLERRCCAYELMSSSLLYHCLSRIAE